MILLAAMGKKIALGYLVGNSLILTVPNLTLFAAEEGRPGHAMGSAIRRSDGGLMPGGCRRSLTAAQVGVHIHHNSPRLLRPIHLLASHGLAIGHRLGIR